MLGEERCAAVGDTHSGDVGAVLVGKGGAEPSTLKAVLEAAL